MIYNKEDPTKGGLYHMHNGYLSFYRLVDGTRKRFKCHRHILEMILGRKLYHFEIVHHINGNRLDNDLNNLKIMTIEEHSSTHGGSK